MLNFSIIVSLIFIQFLTDSIFSLTNDDPINIDDLDTADAILLSQSGTCSESDNLNRIQCFRELPLPKYEIFEGEDVMISCRVAYQKGKLQWAFKGKMLGFDRTIPTHVRMQMPGNPAIGDHSLFIENVKVADSGNYECQLSPAASQPPRRRLTSLVVLKIPSPPIIYQNGKSNKLNISLSVTKGEIDSFINLTCVSFHGNPFPTFEWSVNNVPLKHGTMFRMTKVYIESISNETSFLSIKSTQIFNGDMIKCGVSNTATKKMANISEKLITTEVRVFKRTLPGKIVIKEIVENDRTIIVTEGNQLQLTCICYNPGDPPIDLKWQSNEDDKSINPEWISTIKNEMISQNTIKVPNITRKWHKKSLYCSGTQDGFPASRPALVLVFVNHPPSKVDLEAVSTITNLTLRNPSTIYCKENQLVRLSCISSTYYTDNVRIMWYIKNTEDSEWQPASTSSERVIVFPDGRLKLMKSTLEISPSLISKEISSHILSRLLSQVVCIMKSTEFHIEERKEVKLELFEQPSIPIITINGQIKPPILTNGETSQLKCSVTGGHPTPELHLLDVKNQEIKSSSFNQIGMTKLEYNIEVKPTDNGKQFRCVVFYKNVLNFLPLSSDIMVLRVARPPEQLHMKLTPSKDNLKANQIITFQCATDASFPEAKIEWWWHHSCKNAQTLTFGTTSQDIRSTCFSEILNEPKNIIYKPTTQATLSSISIKLTPRFDLSFIECLVVPHEKWMSSAKFLAKLTKLRVQYPPRFEDDKTTELKRYTVEEGHNFSITIKSQAYPSINGYTWLINKHPMEQKPHIYLGVDKFSLVNAQPEMIANYTLLVENQLGKAAFNFFLNVTFGPKLLGPILETIKINPQLEYKQKSVIVCSAQANPFREMSTVRWVREASKILDQDELLNIIQGQTLFSQSDNIHCAKGHWKNGNVSINCISLGDIEIVSSLQILSIDYRYIGSYKCIFSNTIKRSSAIKTTNLVFPTHPVPIRNLRKSEFVSRFLQKSELICYFVSYPIPTVRWILSYKNKSMENSLKYSTSISSPFPGVVKAMLSISDTNEFDHGKYTCLASNQYGESAHSVFLDRPRVPTQPTNLTVINVTDTSISLGWILGFNGGSKQTIQLRWRLRDADPNSDYNLVDISEDEDVDVQFYTITRLYREREYEISLRSINRYTSNHATPTPIYITTINYANSGGDANIIQNDSKRVSIKDMKQERNNANIYLVIILLVTVGALLLSIKIGLIVYFVHKRKMKNQKSREKMSSPTNHQMIETLGYLNNEDSIEMRQPSLVRSGIESNMYAQSLSDHLSQNGSDNGLKLNYYKTNSDDQFQSPYLGPELDLVASVIGRNNFDINALPPNFHPAYIQLAESSSMTGVQEPYITGYFTQRPYYNQTPSRTSVRKSSHSSIDTSALPQYPISSTYQRRVEKVPYPQSAVSISTTSGDSNCSQSPPRKYIGYSPLANQSGAPSTVEEYLSSGNSASESHRIVNNGSDEYFQSPMTSFRLGQCTDLLTPEEFYSPVSSNQQQIQESTHGILMHRIQPNSGKPSSPYRIYNDQQRFSMSSENDHLLKPPLDFSGTESTNFGNVQPQLIDTHKLNYVDLIAHSSPSVIRFTGSISENL